MSKQIAVRLPDEMVERIDGLVAEGEVPSRAALVTSALEREFRRRLAEQDARILAALPPGESAYPDLDGLAKWTVRNFPPLD